MSKMTPNRLSRLKFCADNPEADDAGDLYREMCGYTGRALSGWKSWLNASRHALRDKGALWETKPRGNKQSADFIGPLEELALHPSAVLEAAAPELLNCVRELEAENADLRKRIRKAIEVGEAALSQAAPASTNLRTESAPLIFQTIDDGQYTEPR